jgi:hypothetical protein
MTSYDEIIDLALVSIEDYRLNKLSVSSPENFQTILDGFMIKGLSSFDNCAKDLDDRNDSERHFNFKLTGMEKDIIADYTVIAWLDKEINDTSQITGMLQNKTEANRFAESNNLRAKMDLRVKRNEDTSAKKSAYALKRTPWKDWAGDNYGL